MDVMPPYGEKFYSSFDINDNYWCARSALGIAAEYYNAFHDKKAQSKRVRCTVAFQRKLHLIIPKRKTEREPNNSNSNYFPRTTCLWRKVQITQRYTSLD